VSAACFIHQDKESRSYAAGVLRALNAKLPSFNLSDSVIAGFTAMWSHGDRAIYLRRIVEGVQDGAFLARTLVDPFYASETAIIDRALVMKTRLGVSDAHYHEFCRMLFMNAVTKGGVQIPLFPPLSKLKERQQKLMLDDKTGLLKVFPTGPPPPAAGAAPDTVQPNGARVSVKAVLTECLRLGGIRECLQTRLDAKQPITLCFSIDHRVLMRNVDQTIAGFKLMDIPGERPRRSVGALVRSVLMSLFLPLAVCFAVPRRSLAFDTQLCDLSNLPWQGRPRRIQSARHGVHRRGERDRSPRHPRPAQPAADRQLPRLLVHGRRRAPLAHGPAERQRDVSVRMASAAVGVVARRVRVRAADAHAPDHGRGQAAQGPPLRFEARRVGA
jgi:hypothetical protein